MCTLLEGLLLQSSRLFGLCGIAHDSVYQCPAQLSTLNVTCVPLHPDLIFGVTGSSFDLILFYLIGLFSEIRGKNPKHRMSTSQPQQLVAAGTISCSNALKIEKVNSSRECAGLSRNKWRNPNVLGDRIC
uniref:Uncharacterized protein n=1 Tax=Spongospora subterranea TaxID=70186 RepID=A0A0H5QWA4_9EUKA|eukprot:CRZ05906.1 hypothetical protein [Spongospora subterranea]